MGNTVRKDVDSEKMSRTDNACTTLCAMGDFPLGDIPSNFNNIGFDPDAHGMDPGPTRYTDGNCAGTPPGDISGEGPAANKNGGNGLNRCLNASVPLLDIESIDGSKTDLTSSDVDGKVSEARVGGKMNLEAH